MQHRCNTTFAPCSRRLSCALALPHHTAKVQSAIELWLANQKSDSTRRAYRREIQAFAVFVGWKDEPEAIAV